MQLILENGCGILDANSYIDIADVEMDLPSTAFEKYQALTPDQQIDRVIIASLFIDSSFNWLGKRKTLEQGLSWPRLDIYYQGFEVPDSFIPKQLKRACVMIVSLINDFGFEILQNTGEAQVKREKLGPLETEYFEALKVEYLNSSKFAEINNLLRGLYYKPGGVLTAEVIRK